MNKKIFLWMIGIALLLPIVQAGKVNYSVYASCDSDSMAPTFTCKDKLVVNTVTLQDEIKVGEIYCYRADARIFYYPWYYYTCHRLLETDGRAYIFKGDNNKLKDIPVERRFVAWKIINF